VKPFISYPRETDLNANRIDDQFEIKLAIVARAAVTGVLANPPAVQAALQQDFGCELVFSRQVTQAQIDTFMRLGGKITHVFQHASYGWTGTLPLGNLQQIRAAMGQSLVVIAAPIAVKRHMDEATRNSRVRPVWAAGFGGVASGFRGSPSINIAIVDSGVDGTHTDLTGRMEYWKDWTADNEPSPRDTIEHGSHVAGIAVGSGAAFDLNPTQLLYTDSGDMTGFPDGVFLPSRIHIPVAPAAFTLVASWLGGGTTDLILARSADGTQSYSGLAGGNGTSGLGGTISGITPTTGFTFTPALISAAGVGIYAIVNSVSYAPVGDGFPTMSGVAPLSRWAGFKIFGNDGSGSTIEIGNAIDDIIIQRIPHNIKVANFSIGLIDQFGQPVQSSTFRDKVNTLAANGIVPVVSAGNDGPGTSMGDPARASLVLTVGASNDINQLTRYTSLGFTAISANEDNKPDILAPGGSDFYSFIMSVDSNSSDAGINGVLDVRANDYKNISGTSMAAPHISGVAALIIQALESTGVTWNFNGTSHTRLVKMLICASGTETNTGAEPGGNNPPVGRSTTPKDTLEGYGMVNTDAAIEAVTIPLAETNALVTGTTTGTRFDRRAWGRRVNLTAGVPFKVTLDIGVGGVNPDFDLYLYSSTPDAKGNPVRLASSAIVGANADEAISFTPSTTETGYLFIKRVSGSGSWSLFRTSTTPTLLSISPTSVAAGGPSFTLTCRGTNFDAGSKIVWNGVGQANTTFIDQTQLTASIPSGLISATGFARITIRRGVAESNSQIITIGKPNLVTTATLSRNGGQIDIVVTVRNTGTAPAAGYALTKATLQNLTIAASPVVNTITSLPKVLGTLAAGASTTTTVSFPGSVGTGGQSAELKIGIATVTTSGVTTVIRTILP
jgi:subtilisin family serine protease